jgi:hypothetical protein
LQRMALRVYLLQLIRSIAPDVTQSVVRRHVSQHGAALLLLLLRAWCLKLTGLN